MSKATATTAKTVQWSATLEKVFIYQSNGNVSAPEPQKPASTEAVENESPRTASPVSLRIFQSRSSRQQTTTESPPTVVSADELLDQSEAGFSDSSIHSVFRAALRAHRQHRSLAAAGVDNDTLDMAKTCVNTLRERLWALNAGLPLDDQTPPLTGRYLARLDGFLGYKKTLNQSLGKMSQQEITEELKHTLTEIGRKQRELQDAVLWQTNGVQQFVLTRALLVSTNQRPDDDGTPTEQEEHYIREAKASSRLALERIQDLRSTHDEDIKNLCMDASYWSHRLTYPLQDLGILDEGTALGLCDMVNDWRSKDKIPFATNTEESRTARSQTLRDLSLDLEQAKRAQKRAHVSRKAYHEVMVETARMRYENARAFDERILGWHADREAREAEGPKVSTFSRLTALVSRGKGKDSSQ